MRLTAYAVELYGVFLVISRVALLTLRATRLETARVALSHRPQLSAQPPELSN